MTSVIQSPNYFIIRYGSLTLTHASVTNVNFDVPFPTACVAVIPYSKHLGFAQTSTISVDNWTKTGFQIYEQAGGAGMTVGWVAFGY